MRVVTNATDSAAIVSDIFFIVQCGRLSNFRSSAATSCLSAFNSAKDYFSRFHCETPTNPDAYSGRLPNNSEKSLRCYKWGQWAIECFGDTAKQFRLVLLDDAICANDSYACFE